MGDINQYRCIYLADYRENDKLCRAIERVKELEKEYDKLTKHFIDNHVPKSKIKDKIEELEKENRVECIEFNQDVIKILQELLGDE